MLSVDSSGSGRERSVATGAARHDEEGVKDMTHSYRVRAVPRVAALETGRRFIGVQCMVKIEQSLWRTVVRSYRGELPLRQSGPLAAFQ